MSAAHAPLIPELEEALRQVAADKRVETVQRVTELFVAGAAHFNDLQIRLFDRVLCRLVVDTDSAALETAALVELARRLAPFRNAPPDLMRRLARCDAIAVAGPVLMRSDCLDEEDLVEIARTKSQPHLFAISGRSAVSETVTDALVEYGDRHVARNLALNHRAGFSPSGLAILVERAAHDPVLADKLSQRQDLTGHLSWDLLISTTIAAQQDVAEPSAPEAEPENPDPVPDVEPESQHAAPATPCRDHVLSDDEVWQSVHAMKQGGCLDEARVLEFARAGRGRETAVALALTCDVSLDMVRCLIAGDQPDAALILCQAAGFSAPAARAIAGSSAKTRAPVDSSCGDLDRLSPATAAQIVGFWRACHGELRAAS